MSTLLTKLTADFSTQLASALSVGGTSATLLSQTDDDGNTIPDGNYSFTLDGASSNKEHIRCVKTGLNLTSIQSLSRQGALTSGVVRAHRIGTSVVITDWAQLKYLTDILTGDTDLDASNPLKYDGTATLSNDADLATKKYVDDTAIAGSPKATDSVYGITKLSVAAVSPTDPIAVGTNDTRVPTQSENDALVGTSGTPSSTNKYVTNDDTSSTPSASKVVRYTAGATLAATTATTVNYQVFTSSGTWTKPSGLTGNELVIVQLWGAGGGGGGVPNAQTPGAGGGGGGGYTEAKFRASDLGSTVSVTIGTGGSGGVGAANGSNGGNTTFGSLLTAYGGGGGGQGNGGTWGGGGGGGGNVSAGSAGGTGTVGAGGSPLSSATASTGNSFGGGTGGIQGTLNGVGGASTFGGGGGGSSAAVVTTGGGSYYGGGGGGGGNPSGSAGAGGASLVYGGNGGAGGLDADGSAGVAPGGGGGGAGNNSGATKTGGAGARGECRVFVNYSAN